MHVSEADLEPGDLVFFFADIGHVGFYIGNGLMVDAPEHRPGGLVQRVESASAWRPSATLGHGAVPHRPEPTQA